MTDLSRPSSRHVVTRLICAAFALGAVAAAVLTMPTHLMAGRFPAFDVVIGLVATVFGGCVFGYCAVFGGRDTNRGVLSEPSDAVQALARGAGSRVEAIKAYREETGVDVRRAILVIDRLASSRR